MRVLVAALLLGLCAVRTVAQLETWRSDEALWRRAVVVSPHLPRPALNLGVALVRRGLVSEGTHWTVRAAELSEASPETRRKARAFLTWIDVMHAPICDQPSVSRWCAP